MTDKSNLSGVAGQTGAGDTSRPPSELAQADLATGLSVVAQPAAPLSQRGGARLEFENVQLLSRFVVGALILGVDELLEQLRSVRQEIEADPRLLSSSVSLEEESTAALLRYLALGLYVRGQRGVAGAVRKGVQLSLDTAGWALGGLNRLTSNRLTRPLRRSVADRMKSWGEEVVNLIKEGRLEEQNARLLTGRTVTELIDEVLAYMAENPELVVLIQKQIGQQSAGLAGVVANNARQVTVTADYVTEAIIRRLLMRKARQDLPPSPLMGKPQTMYSVEVPAQGTDGHEG